MCNQNLLKILNKGISPPVGIFIIVLCFLLAGGILAGQYWMLRQENLTPLAPVSTPTPDETANWKTYRNEEYGFEVRYPQEWFVKENPIPSFAREPKEIKMLYSISICNTEGCLGSAKGPEGTDTTTIISINVSGNPGLSLEQWIDELEKIAKYGPLVEGYGERKVIVVADTQGFEATFGCCQSSTRAIWLLKNSKVYTIYFSGYDGFFPNEDTSKKILSTLRFIKGSCGSLLSPNKKILASCKDNNHREISLYNYETKEIKLLANYPKDSPLYIDSWSPNDKYLLTDFGTSPVRTKNAYEISTGKNTASFQSYSKPLWLNNEEVLFLELQEVTPPRPWESGEGSGISIINLATGEKKVLKKATELKQYGSAEFKLLDNGDIQFSLTEVSSPDNWGIEGRISFWVMNKNGDIIKQVLAE